MSDQSKETPQVSAAPGDKGARQRALAVETIAALRTLFPRAFPVDQRRPLKIGIDRDLRARLTGNAAPAISRTALRAALRLYTGDGAYLLSLAEGAERVDLDGRPAGTVTAEEAGEAKTRRDEIARARCASKHRAKPDKQPSATISATPGKQTGKASKADEDGDKTAAQPGAKRMSLAELRAAGAERRRDKSRE